MDRHQAKALIAKYNAGNCSEEEKSLVEGWYNDLEYIADAPEANEIVIAKDKVWAELSSKRKNFKLDHRIAAAAAILLVVGAGLFFYNRYANTLRHLEGSAATRDLLANDIKPGANKAILTLANGSTITLTDASNGKLAKEAGVEITKTANGQVVYSSLPSGISPRGGERGVVLNTIETPRGGQYQVRLPDGSKVWLNAASKLTYPVSFNGREDRRVELSGEAYFEIAKDKNHPFKVKTTSQEVQVLGTHFNINSYADEVSTKTTLLKGSVKVTTSLPLHPASLSLQGRGGKAGEGEGFILKPNQQSTLQNGTLKITEVNPSQAIAWKNGGFVFESEPIQTVMRKIARWYDVDVEYKGTPNIKQYTGTISRTENIAQILALLEKTGTVKFEITAKKIIVK